MVEPAGSVKSPHRRRVVRSSGDVRIVPLPDSVALHPVYQGFTADIEITSGARLVPPTLLQGLQDEFLLDGLQANALRIQVDFESVDASFFLAKEFWQVLNCNLVAASQDDDALHYILKLSNVTWPAVLPEIR